MTHKHTMRVKENFFSEHQKVKSKMTTKSSCSVFLRKYFLFVLFLKEFVLLSWFLYEVCRTLTYTHTHARTHSFSHSFFFLALLLCLNYFLSIHLSKLFAKLMVLASRSLPSSFILLSAPAIAASYSHCFFLLLVSTLNFDKI